jgi:predicted Abi (CAAX) family protease
MAVPLATFILAVTEGTGLLGPMDPGLGPDRLAAVALALLFPALVEEALFRGPLAHPRLRRPAVAAASLAAYVVWHPVGARLRPELAVMARPGFLAITAALGLACTVSVWRSGSILPAVAMHWAVVSGWVLFYGGP